MTELRWYVLSVCIAIGGFAAQVFSTSARQAGVGAVVITLGFGVGFVRYVAVRLTRLSDAIGVDPVTIVHDKDLNSLAVLMYREAVERHQERLAAIRRGIVTIRDPDEMLDMLINLSKQAKAEIWAVDCHPLAQWFEPGFEHYLRSQLKRVKGKEITLRRFRIVDRGETADLEQRSLLSEFAALHRDAGAELLLYYSDQARRRNLVFSKVQGAVIIDPTTRTPACLAGVVGSDHTEHALLSLRREEPLTGIITDCEQLARRIEEGGWDRQVRGDMVP